MGFSFFVYCVLSWFDMLTTERNLPVAQQIHVPKHLLFSYSPRVSPVATDIFSLRENYGITILNVYPLQVATALLSQAPLP